MGHAGTVRRAARIRAPRARVWRRVSDIGRLHSWAEGAAGTDYLTRRRRGVGAARLVAFADGRRVEEHVTAWKAGESYTYVATAGLPVSAYVATVSLGPARGGTAVTWRSYVCSDSLGRDGFAALLESLGAFYGASLANLARQLETKV